MRQAADLLNTLPKPHLTIQPRSGWQALDLRELWQFRDLLTTLAKRDVTLRYRQTALGVVWVVLQPLLGALIFSFVFGRIAHLPSEGVPYLVFAFAGLLGWNAFSATLTRTSASLVQSAALVSKVYFPRLVLPLSTVYSAVIDFGVSLVVMFVLMALYGIVPTFGLLLLPVWLLGLLLLAAGLGLYLSALTVRYRDVQYILPVVVNFLLYGSPVAYAASAVPAHLRAVFFLNPLSGLLEAFRWSLLGRGQMPWGHVFYALAVSILVFLWGAFAFKSLERTFADVI